MAGNCFHTSISIQDRLSTLSFSADIPHTKMDHKHPCSHDLLSQTDEWGFLLKHCLDHKYLV